MPQHPCYVYVSSKASVDPVKTVIVCPPEENARTVEDAERFAYASGWVNAVEADASVLVVAISPEGWDAVPVDLPYQLYQENRRSFKSGGMGSAAAGGSLWAWETLIYLVGYADGATFAGNFQLSCPGFAAASVLVDGSPTNTAALDEPSIHWLVSQPRDYAAKNRDIPMSVWFMGEGDSVAMREHVLTVDHAVLVREIEVAGRRTEVFENPKNAGMQMRVTPELTGAAPAIAAAGIDFFCRVIRWKNAPDGTLALRRTKEEFYHDGTYYHDEVEHGGEHYHYAVYLPRGYTRIQARGLALVISIHGRGEPTWIFSAKNGWEDLADETRAFALMLPDSPGNVWSEQRDVPALIKMIERTLDLFGLCRERTYITGFSNGAVFTCQIASLHPEYFAAASPWNGPSLEAITSSGLGRFIVSPDFVDKGYDIPFWIACGDADDKAGELESDEVQKVLSANGCDAAVGEGLDAHAFYTPDKGYAQGNRFSTVEYRNGAGVVMVSLTRMKNMPHGAIADEARAAWEFMKRFSRPVGARRVEVI